MRILNEMYILVNVNMVKVDLQVTLGECPEIKQWAYIIHDKDNAVPHYHIYLNLGFSPASCFDVASWLQLPCWSVNILKGHARDLFLYFMHSAGCVVNKHEYSISDFVSNFDIETLISGRRQ